MRDHWMKVRHAMAWALLGSSVGASSACAREAPPAERQVLLTIRTDAPLPSSSSSSSSSGSDSAGGAPEGKARALFDRLQVELYPPGSDTPCANCVESFALDRETVDQGRASIGIVVPRGEAGHRLRLTLYAARGRGPRERSSIVHVHSLPPLAEGQRFAGHVALRVDETGRPNARGTLSEPIALASGEGTPLPIWPEARSVPCVGAPSSDEACAPGSAFWMGDPSLEQAGQDDVGGARERLAVVSPFFIDRHEVTVRELRESGLARFDDGGRLFDPADDLGPNSVCTYRAAPGESDLLPVNCVSRLVARAYCARRGKRLPTEAELEYLEGGLESSRYVWGVDRPSCDDAVFGRTARGPCAGAGPREAGAGKRDHIELNGVSVVDLAGNLSEWVDDLWNGDEESCFLEPVARNPRCDTPSAKGLAFVMRGGNFTEQRLDTAAVRTLVPTSPSFEGVSDQIGFRCARDAPR